MDTRRLAQRAVHLLPGERFICFDLLWCIQVYAVMLYYVPVYLLSFTVLALSMRFIYDRVSAALRHLFVWCGPCVYHRCGPCMHQAR